MIDPYENWYETINNGLLRRRRTGSFATKQPNRTDSFIPFDQLPDYEFDPNEFFGHASPYSLKRDNNGKPGERGISKRVISDEECEEALAADFEVSRVQSYEEINEHRESHGLTPWYILTREELESVGLCLPYSLSINPDHVYVKEKIKQEGQRIKELGARGIKAMPWSTWKDGD